MPEEARSFLDAVNTTIPISLRNRALIGLIVYIFALIDAATAMRVEDMFV